MTEPRAEDHRRRSKPVPVSPQTTRLRASVEKMKPVTIPLAHIWGDEAGFRSIRVVIGCRTDPRVEKKPGPVMYGNAVRLTNMVAGLALHLYAGPSGKGSTSSPS